MLTKEGHRLAKHWSSYGATHLDEYLIQSFEHPAINPQSILIRDLVLDEIQPGIGREIIEDELLYSACACHILDQAKKKQIKELYRTITENPENLDEGYFLADAVISKSFSLRELIEDLSKCSVLGFEFFQSPFTKKWSKQIKAQPQDERLSILEVGCGSANDYRFWKDYGFAEHIDFHGVDVCPENIENSKKRFPDVDFSVGDACSLPHDNSSIDVVLAFDLLEHLSEESINSALAEFARIARREIWINLFAATTDCWHHIVPSGNYHRNRISIHKLVEELERLGFSVSVISIKEQMERRFLGYTHYNPNAAIIIGEKCEPGEIVNVSSVAGLSENHLHD